MIDKLRIIWLKIGNYLLWTLVAVLCVLIGYLLFAHRKAIAALTSGESLPERDGDTCCLFRKK